MKMIEPGCLAIISNAIIPENIGKPVKVIRQHRRTAHPTLGPDTQYWRIESNENLPCTNQRKDLFTSNFAYHPEEWLLRIDGLSPEELEIRETIKA